MEKSRAFDARNIELNGLNLVEASAGTGKTYSIAVLVLRLVIEKKVPLEKILMVTFTKAAVAELETRIRRFIRQAFRYASGTGNADTIIAGIVDQAGKETARPVLKQAVQSLDELSVMTIHSFCEKCLLQYPFETGQSFAAEISTDITSILDYIVNDYWRKEINTLAPDIFQYLTRQLSRERIRTVLQKVLDDKVYLCPPIDEETTLQLIEQGIQQKENARQEFENYIRENFSSITSQTYRNRYANEFVQNCSDSPESFMEAFLARYRKGTQYLSTCFPQAEALCSAFIRAEDTLNVYTAAYIYHTFHKTTGILRKSVEDFKSGRQLIDFNDQIKFLHRSVEKGLVNDIVASQYQAVFIDEFQDTDAYQYEIFSRLFSKHTVFYIGDPKQSIYGWRKADIATYKRAKNEVHRIYSMNLNFRSTGELLKDLNHFFSIPDPFYDTEIQYEAVSAGNTGLGEMTTGDGPFRQMELFSFNNKEEIQQFTASEIAEILNNESVKINGSRIKPSDIAVIVRKNSEARSLKKALSQVNVPAVTVDDTKVMDSDEAGIIRYLMEAVIQPARGNINRVLLNPCFGHTIGTLLKTDDTSYLEIFRELKQVWTESGIYNMLFRAFDLLQVRSECLNLGIYGQRVLTNFYHIAEILHNTAQRKNYTPSELLQWSYRAVQQQDDEYEQRIESQDDAVQITTIHKCKGLTYKVVFAPYLDLVVTEYEFYEFRENGKYCFTHTPSPEQRLLWQTQATQENRRLIYVALTRAQYKVYVCVNNSNKCNNSSLRPFLVNAPVPQVNTISAAVPYDAVQNGTEHFTPRPLPTLTIRNTFGIHSFSSLNRLHFAVPSEKSETDDSAYNNFIFRTVGRGASVGKALHSIFEHLNFGNCTTWEQTLRDASEYYSGMIPEEHLPHYHTLLDHVMNVPVNINGTNFRLSDINHSRKLPELEFCFAMNKVNRKQLDDILGEMAELSGEAEIEGLMTGFIDLMFEHEKKFYILDWKSNHLGNTCECYNREGMEAAMKGSNYHLQYLLYTVALKRWLEKRMPGFDYDTHFGGIIYVFLRGVRKDSATGIYALRPVRDQIMQLENVLMEKEEEVNGS